MGKVLILKDADFSQNAIDDDKDYVLADSITFDGSHYIDIGRGLTQQSKIEICLTPTESPTGNQNILVCGARTGANVNQVDARIIVASGGVIKFSINMVNNANNPGNGVNVPATINSQHTISADIKNNNVTIDGATYVNERVVTGLNTMNNLYIGAYNVNGEILSGITFYKGNIYWIKIYDNDTLSNFYNAATIKATGVSCLVDKLHDENKYYLVS